MIKKCLKCCKEFKDKPSHIIKRKYCSQICYWVSKIGNIISNSGQFKKGHIPINKIGKAKDRGYFKIITSDGRRIREHRYIMEQYLGRRLKQNEIVHHINYDRADNRLENLQILDRATHNRVHILHDRWGGNYV